MSSEPIQRGGWWGPCQPMPAVTETVRASLRKLLFPAAVGRHQADSVTARPNPLAGSGSLVTSMAGQPLPATVPLAA
jgi:hypothetical protein